MFKSNPRRCIILRDIGDIIDRTSIAKLKSERIGTPETHKEYLAFEEERRKVKEQYPNIPIDLFSAEMYKINSFIWALESALKSGREDLPNPYYLDDDINIPKLAPIGKTSILIRNINTFRVGLKNIVNKMVGEGFQDAKSQHLSS